LDSKGIEWCLGTYRKNRKKKCQKENIIYLPFQIRSMYPITQDNLIYCTCVECGKSIESGILCLEFNTEGFGIRLSCCKEANNLFFIDILIISVFDILEPIIKNGLDTKTNKCNVCEKRNCKSEECTKTEGVIYQSSALIPIFEHFYQIQLDICSPLIYENICSVCQKPDAKKCGICRIYQFCSKKCQKSCSHTCTPFYEIWRP